MFYILNTIDRNTLFISCRVKQFFQKLSSFFQVILNKYGAVCKSKIKFEPSVLVKKLYDIVEMNHLNSANESSTSWSMISDNFVLNEENILITCRLIIRLLLLGDEKDSKIDKELKENVLAFFKVVLFHK